MPFKGMHRLSTVSIPYEQLSTLSPAANRGQPPPIGAPSYTHHGSLMSCQLALLCAIGCIPQKDGAIITPAGHPRAIRAPRHAIEEGVSRVRVSNDLETGAHGWVPEPDGTIPAGTGQPAAIRTPCHAVDIPAMAAQHASW